MPFFETDQVKFHYEEYGTGHEVMLAFHGFGMRGTQFRHLEPALGTRYKIYSFDLFFHGHTSLKNNALDVIRKGMTPIEFAAQLKPFIDQVSKSGKISLLSYSIGSCLALALLQELPGIVDEVFFIAPDGIKPNKLLRIGASFKPVNNFFWKLVNSPKVVNFSLRLLNKLNYIDDSLCSILDREFGTTESRMVSYNTITFNSKMVFDKEKLAQLINANNIKCYLYFGRKDVLFPPSIGKEFSALLENSVLHIEDDGHDLVNPRLNNVIANHLAVYN
ncbi:alpha/beta hydrolase [Solitalea sp. MAHUQ-68]|uniref:Alpha/beta hydrolase n=1 Tax=Solitalea agri TaxID=2953739 RepID=A0A9X2JEU9_9SPHI|nr:alpha/beta hydrolase [Solitalea agri]MCO4294310.1 alpha/beta hydrolase [Solitalea agri]